MDRNDESLLYARESLIVRDSCSRCKNYTREVVNLRYFIQFCIPDAGRRDWCENVARGKVPTNRSADSSGCAIAKYEMIEIVIHLFPERTT